MRPIALRGGLLSVLLVGFALTGCGQEPDVGQPCAFPEEMNMDACTVNGDYLSTGNTECENLACMFTPSDGDDCATRTPVCSKPCVSNNDCYEKETGMICRRVAFDEAYIAFLEQSTEGQALLDLYLKNRMANYCAYPEP